MTVREPVLAMIVAAAENGVIGRDNGLPWRLADDLRHFKAVTLGKPVIMGRRTFDSIGRPLPGRDNLVVTRQSQLAAAGVSAFQSLDAAIDAALGMARASGKEEAMLLGGAQLYAQGLPRVQRIYLTRVHAQVEGDTFLPELDPRAWREVSRERREADARNDHACSFIVLERRG
jgi:dihydrofolate reductase